MEHSLSANTERRMDFLVISCLLSKTTILLRKLLQSRTPRKFYSLYIKTKKKHSGTLGLTSATYFSLTRTYYWLKPAHLPSLSFSEITPQLTEISTLNLSTCWFLFINSLINLQAQSKTQLGNCEWITYILKFHLNTER